MSRLFEYSDSSDGESESSFPSPVFKSNSSLNDDDDFCHHHLPLCTNTSRTPKKKRKADGVFHAPKSFVKTTNKQIYSKNASSSKISMTESSSIRKKSDSLSSFQTQKKPFDKDVDIEDAQKKNGRYMMLERNFDPMKMDPKNRASNENATPSDDMFSRKYKDRNDNDTLILQNIVLSMKDEGMNNVFDLLYEECPTPSGGKSSDNSYASPYKSSMTAPTKAQSSQFTPQGQDIINHIEIQLTKYPEKSQFIHMVYPSWKETIQCVPFRTDVNGMKETFEKVQQTIQKMQTWKEKMIQTWDEQIYIIKLFESYFQQSWRKELSESENDDTMIHGDRSMVDSIESNSIVELSDDNDDYDHEDSNWGNVSVFSPESKEDTLKAQIQDQDLYSLNKHHVSSAVSADKSTGDHNTPHMNERTNHTLETMPNFNTMDMETLKTFMLKYGFRPASKKEMIHRLTEIFRAKHKKPRNNNNAANPKANKTFHKNMTINQHTNQNKVPNSHFNTMPNFAAMEMNQMKEIILNFGLKPSTKTHMMNQLIRIYEQKSNFDVKQDTSCHQSQPNRSQRRTKATKFISTHNSIKLSKEEDHHSLHKQCMEAIQSNEKLHVSILERRSIELAQIQDCIQQKGIVIQKAQLIDFLDEQGVMVVNPWRKKK